MMERHELTDLQREGFQPCLPPLNTRCQDARPTPGHQRHFVESGLTTKFVAVCDNHLLPLATLV